MRILALDANTQQIGWAVFEDDEVQAQGVDNVPGNSLDEKCSLMTSWVANRGYYSPTRGCTILAIEMPVMARNAKTTIQLAQLIGAIRAEGWMWFEEVIEVLPQQRLTALGLPVRMKRADAKAAVLRSVNQIHGLELTAKQHDAADAIAVGMAALAKLRERELTE